MNNSGRKRSFSLMEIFIALSLLTILITFLFSTYKKNSFEKKEAQELLKPLLEERYADIRLGRVLTKAKKEKQTLFANDERGLIFIFDHGAHPDPLLSGPVLGNIFFDRKKEMLMLEIRPHPESGQKNPSLTYEILDQVKELSFLFYYPPKDPQKIVNPQSVGDSIPQSYWQSSWKEGYHELPTMVKIIVKRPLFFPYRNEVEFTYFFEENDQEINVIR